MSPARRSIKRRDWPRGLQERRPGYYSWVDPRDGTEKAIGRVPLAVAKAEATAANLYVAEHQPTLLEKLTGKAHTIADLLGKMPEAETDNTAKHWRTLDNAIREALGTVACGSLTVAQCADLVEGYADDGKERMGSAIRSRLIAICKRGMRLGWMDGNPAEVTDKPKAEVKRARLTLEAFQAIYAKAGDVAEWLPIAMQLAIVTGADRDTIASLERAAIGKDHLTIRRGKTRRTNRPIEIPLALTLDAVGWTLRDVLSQRTGVVSRLVVHHVNPWGNAPAGSKVHPDRISRAFTEARKAAKLPDLMEGGKLAPTFHEIRSLAKRLYDKQGNVDTKALLGHATERMSDLYSDDRGVAPVRVSIRQSGRERDNNGTLGA